jgi:hypothetical protein
MVLRFGSCEKAMAYKLKYHPDVKRPALPKIDAKNRDMIKGSASQTLIRRLPQYHLPACPGNSTGSYGAFKFKKRKAETEKGSSRLIAG